MEKRTYLYIFGENIDGQIGIGKTATSVNCPALINYSFPYQYHPYNPNRIPINHSNYNKTPNKNSPKKTKKTDNNNTIINDNIPFSNNTVDLLNLNINFVINITSISCGSRHTLALDQYGVIMSWGWGRCGQLGHGNLRSYSKPRFIEYFFDDNKNNNSNDKNNNINIIKIIKISSGGMHSGCIDENNNVYTWGECSYGQLGLGPEAQASGKISTPSQVYLPGFHKIHNNANIDHNKKSAKEMLRTFRNMPSIDINLQTTSIDNELEADIPLLADKLACGGMHTLALSTDGILYAWGRADNGQLGIGNQWIHDMATGAVSKSWPVTVLFDKDVNITSISVGSFHSAAVTVEGNIYTWGKEDYGMLGFPRSQNSSCECLNTPNLIMKQNYATHMNIKDFENEKKIMSTAKDVSLGGWHTMVIDNEGKAYACGRGEYGRLGIGVVMSSPYLSEVIGMPENSKIISVKTGGSHTLFLTDNNEIYGCGRSDDGRLGFPTNTNSSILMPEKLTSLDDIIQGTNKKIKQIECGGAFSGVIIEEEIDTSIDNNNN